MRDSEPQFRLSYCLAELALYSKLVLFLAGINVEVSETNYSFFFLSFSHRANAAFRALALRSAGVSFAARLLPPFAPPIFPKATACGFFFGMI